VKLNVFSVYFLLKGVALLPFVDEKRLWKALDKVYPDLTDAESKDFYYYPPDYCLIFV
jgi:5'-3' exonuclease